MDNKEHQFDAVVILAEINAITKVLEKIFQTTSQRNQSATKLISSNESSSDIFNMFLQEWALNVAACIPELLNNCPVIAQSPRQKEVECRKVCHSRLIRTFHLFYDCSIN